MLCLEAGQETRIDGGPPRMYYVITGKASLSSDDQTDQLVPGQLAQTEANEEHVLANETEGRLVCLVVTAAGD
jgi:quercetin dioxygenase-like cupin family protein